MSKKKNPRLSENVICKRSVRTSEFNANSEAVCWQFSIMDMSGSLSCKNIGYNDWILILNKMREWETMTWYEILGKRDHAINIEKLSLEAQKRLIELELDDIDEIISLHLDGKKRLIGIRDRNIFRVLWWDKDKTGQIFFTKRSCFL